MLSARDLTKEYRSGATNLAVLKHVSFDIPQGSFVSIVGPSGSGKRDIARTYYAGLDAPSRRLYSASDGADLTRLTEDQRALLRGEKVGLFPDLSINHPLTHVENVRVPLESAQEAAPWKPPR